MSFFISKFLWILINPFSLFIFLFVISFFFLILKKYRISKILFSFTLFYLVLMIIGILAIPTFIKIFFDSSFYASIYVIQIMLVVWFIGSINKLLGFPVFSKIYDSKRLNQLVYLFGMLHLSAFGLWAIFSSYQVDQLVLYLLFISVLECIIFALFILMKYLKNLNSKAIK